MRFNLHSLCAIVGGILFGALATAQVNAQSPAALSGQVSSTQEARMEGVLVNVKREGSTITTTVVTNEQGRYSFPADRVQPGKYTVSIRAVGYILDGPKSVEIPAGGNATADLKLNRARNIHLQLSNAEWMASLPGTDREKQFLTGCTGCHTLQRMFTAQHDVDEWVQVFNRMGRYYPGSTPAQPQLLVSGGERSERPRVDPKIAQAAAQFLVDVSLTNPEAKEYEFKPLPRPKGRATRVIITEYDLPRKNAYPHDVVVDADGHAWYSDFGSQVMGVLDPKTGKVIDYDIPVVRPEQPKGTLDLQLDRDGNLWIAMMYQSAIAKMDRRRGSSRSIPIRRSGSARAPRLRWWRRASRTSTARCGRTTRRPASTTGSISPPENSRTPARRSTRTAGRSAPTAFRPTTTTTCICSSSAAPASVGATPRRSKSKSGARRSRIRGRAAAASIIRTGCGSPNITAASRCSIPRPRPSRNG